MRSDRGPTLVVAACIVHSDNVLLARRNQPSMPQIHGKWEFPGGKMKVGETLHGAIQREIEEELGLNVNVVRLLPHVQSNIYHREDDSTAHYIVLCFECVLNFRLCEPSLDSMSVLDWQWIDKSEVAHVSCLPGTYEFLKCLDRLDTDPSSVTSFSVVLERPFEGMALHRRIFEGVSDLFGDFTVLERRVNLKTKSTHIQWVDEPSPVIAQRRVADRVRSLARHGYMVIESTCPLITPTTTGEDLCR